MKAIIYKVESPSKKVYIGITIKSLKGRKRKHEISAKNGSVFKIHKAIRKYGDRLKWSILDVVESWEDALNLEIFYIKLFNSFKTGYNSTLGGEGQLGNKPMLGKKQSQEFKNSASLRMKGIVFSDKTLDKMSKAKKGIKLSKIHTLNALKGRGMRSFEVYKQGTLIGIFENQCACARNLKLNRSMISHCLRYPEEYKSHKGFVFKYQGNSNV